MKTRTKKLLLASTLCLVSAAGLVSTDYWLEAQNNGPTAIATAVAEPSKAGGHPHLAENLRLERSDLLLEFDPILYRTRLHQAHASFA